MKLKLKFIFNMAGVLAGVPALAILRQLALRSAPQPWACGRRCPCRPAYAQQPGNSAPPPPTPAVSPATTPTATDPADPPPGRRQHRIDVPAFQGHALLALRPGQLHLPDASRFPALYSGTHSLGPHYEKATSRVLTLYTGVRLNNSTEFLVDIEEAGGAALSLRLRPRRQHQSRYRPQSPRSAKPLISAAA